MADLLESCKALLELDKKNALSPHGLGGHGRACLTWAVEEIERLQEAKRRALNVADERSKENVALRAELERLRALAKG